RLRHGNTLRRAGWTALAPALQHGDRAAAVSRDRAARRVRREEVRARPAAAWAPLSAAGGAPDGASAEWAAASPPWARRRCVGRACGRGARRGRAYNAKRCPHREAVSTSSRSPRSRLAAAMRLVVPTAVVLVLALVPASVSAHANSVSFAEFSIDSR